MQSPLVYPGLHPLSQTPLCLWHEVSFRQWPLHLLIQSYPKVPSSHSKSVYFYKYLMTHCRFSKNNSLVQHILNPCWNVTKRQKSKCVFQKIVKKRVHLYCTTILSIQYHIHRHTDQSRGYRWNRFYNVLYTVESSWHRTNHFCILFSDKKILYKSTPVWPLVKFD